MAKRGRPPHPDILTPREWEVLDLLREGLSNEQIARRLEITERTAKWHVAEILSKLGVGSRAEAAAWQREERRWPLAAFAPLFFWRKLGWGWLPATAGGVAIVAVAAGLGLLAWGLLRMEGDGSSRNDLVRSRVDTSLVVAINDRPPIGTGANAIVTIVDTVDGSSVGEILGGYRPWVLLRSSEEQILVSQLFGPGSISDEPSLRIFDLDDLTDPVMTIAMPNRVPEIIYSPEMVLSENERYLYYAAVRSICPQGGDTKRCDVGSVGIIDLERGGLIAMARLGVGCGFPQLSPAGHEDILAVCVNPAIEVKRITPTGTITDMAVVSMRSYDGYTIGPITTGITLEGVAYVVHDDGMVVEGDQSEPIVDFIQEDGMRAGYSTESPLGPDRFMFLYGDRAEHSFAGLVIFERTDPRNFETFALPFPVTQVAPIDDDRIALLRQDTPVLAVFDLTSRQIIGQFAVPAGAQWLVGD